MDINAQVKQHLDDITLVLKDDYNYPADNILGIFLQGSQNYGLDYEGSDVDTKLIVVPTLKDIAMNNKPISTTYVRPSDSAHTDLKDVRLYMETFKKANINFVEILFTDYKYINEYYLPEWNELVKNREAIAIYNPARAIKSMVGVALEKYHALEHPYPIAAQEIAEYGYSAKQLHHLARVRYFLEDYLLEHNYKDCLNPDGKTKKILMRLKTTHLPLKEARILAQEYLTTIKDMEKEAMTWYDINVYDKAVLDLFDTVQYQIIEKGLRKEIITKS